MKKLILVATDGSDMATKAVDIAARLSRALELDLCIMHVLMHDASGEQWMRMAEIEHLVENVGPEAGLAPGASRTMIADFLGRARKDAIAAQAVNALGEEILEHARERAVKAGARNITTRFCAGDYADEILDLAEAELPEFIVIGSRGLGRVRGALLGSVSQKVVHYAPCPVVVAR
ncbi:universal stress protein [Thioclava atlantica]|uniref:universal stress protein n=1 Tax=Thioclava atlantica TaxID=1317124 RepID=UPI00056E979E|nr:universal stress protein [Thioclava atlantica]